MELLGRKTLGFYAMRITQEFLYYETAVVSLMVTDVGETM